jgi:hypothetical protein
MQSLRPILIPALLTLAGSFVLCTPAAAQSSLFSYSIVGVNNVGGFIGNLDAHFVTDNSAVTATATQSFTGMDGNGMMQTENFTGTTITRSDYGSLHSYTTGSLTNSYYNAANPDYSDHNGNIINPAGSPASFSMLGFSVFNDTLQFGGALQAGYEARYIFHIDGTNSGTGAAADLAVNVGADSDAFFDFNSGPLDTTWATKGFAVNGVTPQQINIQFSDQVVFDTFNLTDGQNYTGTSDFSSTATLAGIEVVDQNGNLTSGWTVTSASGTQYNLIQGSAAVPEPGSVALLIGLGFAGAAGLRKRRRSRA